MFDEYITPYTEGFYEDDYIEDEFGIALKGFLLGRFVFCLICTFMVLGALVCVFTGHTNFDVLISNATGLMASAVDQNFSGYQLCMYLQAAYSILGTASVLLFMIKRSKLFALIDLGLFVGFFAVSIIMGAGSLLFNGSAWILYLVFNPIWSFIALFAGKHFKYMPLI
ncbi:MAG: hypothetical protein IJY73_06500 [Oscillospiraceae bacterium]|nr:hypothetical protein [Oscillospiraceae bacterium]